jgi:hypothetical protein
MQRAPRYNGLRKPAQNELWRGLEGIERHPPTGLRDHGKAWNSATRLSVGDMLPCREREKTNKNS